MVKAQAVRGGVLPCRGDSFGWMGRPVCLVRIMAKDYAKAFYKTKAWKNCRAGYIVSVGGLCERCLRNGLYVPGTMVHHKVHLTPQNIDDPTITLNWSNLELLCRDCHKDEHLDDMREGTNKHHGRKLRYRFNEYGQVII